MSVLVLLALFFRACFCSTFPPLPTPHPTQSIVYASSQAEVVAGIADYTIIKLTAMISVEAEIAISNVAGLVIDGQSIYGFDGGDQNRCLKVKGVDSLMMKDLTLQNGQNEDGGCVRTDASTVTFLRVTFSACKATYRVNNNNNGGGLYLGNEGGSSSVFAYSCQFVNCEADYLGGAIRVYDNCNLELSDTTFAGNDASIDDDVNVSPSANLICIAGCSSAGEYMPSAKCTEEIGIGSTTASDCYPSCSTAASDCQPCPANTYKELPDNSAACEPCPPGTYIADDGTDASAHSSASYCIAAGETPTSEPTRRPHPAPTPQPTAEPTMTPTAEPTITLLRPTSKPTMAPTAVKRFTPSPTSSPFPEKTLMPTTPPSIQRFAPLPSARPTPETSAQPTFSQKTSHVPSPRPTATPEFVTTASPTMALPPPTQPGPTTFPTSPVPTRPPHPPPTHEPTSTPWYSTSAFGSLIGSAAVIGATSAFYIAWLFRRRVGRWPPFFRVAMSGLSVMSVGTDILYCYAASTSEQFCSRCPSFDAPLVIFLNFVICGALLCQRLLRLKIALDGEATFSRASYYAPILMLAAHDGKMIIWLPWTDTPATRALRGYPDVTALEFTSWSIAMRKVPIFIIQMRNVFDKSNSESNEVLYAAMVISGILLLNAIATHVILRLSAQRMKMDVAIVTRDQVAFSETTLGSMTKSDAWTEGGPGSDVAGNGSNGDALALPLLRDGTVASSSSLSSSPLPLATGSSSTDVEASLAAAGSGVQLLRSPREQQRRQRPLIAGNSTDQTLGRFQMLLLVALGVGLPVLIFTDSLPSDSVVEHLLFASALGLVAVIFISGVFMCAVQGVQAFFHLGNRRLVRRSILEQQKELTERHEREIREREEENVRQRERLEYVDRQLEARGILIEEYHRLSEAKRQYEQAWARYINTGSADEEASVTKWGDVLSAHPERVKELAREEEEWAALQTQRCLDALRLMRSFVPRDINSRTQQELVQDGRLSTALARRFLQKRFLWLTVMHPDDIARVHHVDLRNKFDAAGADVVELRAVFAALQGVDFANDHGGEKEAWRSSVRDKLRQMTDREAAGKLTRNEQRHDGYRLRHGNGSMVAGARAGDGSVAPWGPFDPDEPISRATAPVESSAFEKTPQPTINADSGTGETYEEGQRVRELQRMLQQQQQQQQNVEGGRGNTTEAQNHGPRVQELQALLLLEKSRYSQQQLRQKGSNEHRAEAADNSAQLVPDESNQPPSSKDHSQQGGSDKKQHGRSTKGRSWTSWVW